MATFDLTPREANVIILALGTPVGVPKAERPLAESVRLRLKTQLCQPTAPPTIRGHLRSAWPGNHTLPIHKPSQFYDASQVVRLPKATKPAKPTLTVDDVLKGLI